MPLKSLFPFSLFLSPSQSLFPSLSPFVSRSLSPTLALSLPSISFSLCFSPSSLSISPLRGRCDGSVTLTDSDCLLRAVSSCHIHQSHTFISSYYTALSISSPFSPSSLSKPTMQGRLIFPSLFNQFLTIHLSVIIGVRTGLIVGSWEGSRAGFRDVQITLTSPYTDGTGVKTFDDTGGEPTTCDRLHLRRMRRQVNHLTRGENGGWL